MSGARKQSSAATRFRKGESGNPKGRPRSKPSSTASAFDVIVDRTLTVTRNGMAREVTIEEALQHKTYQAALAGDRSARREVLKMIAKRETALAELRGPPDCRIEVRVEPSPPRNIDDALDILGIARDSPESLHRIETYRYLLLEPWAVQLALTRRRGGTALTTKEVDDIRQCTRDAGSIRWPKGTAI